MTDQTLLLKSKEELITLIEAQRKGAEKILNKLSDEKAKLIRETRDLKLQIGALNVFKSSIIKSLDKLQKELG